jgi:aldehyde dehydrogenase (NAD+)
MPMTDFSTIFNEQLKFFNQGNTQSVAFRVTQLKKLRNVIREHEQLIVDALYADLRKPEFEAYGSEIGQVYKEIDFAIRNVHAWAKPKRVPTPMMFLPSSSKIYRDPLGTVLIIAPWNYPYFLSLSPLVAAIAGGNTAFLKPSEEASHTAAVIEKIIQSAFDSNYIAVLQGVGAEIIPSLFEQVRFDHVFFTGSTAVGQKIMELASKKLIPVTLELGGKSPCIVDTSASLDYAARKIAWSKLINAGQTCVAPDYVLVHEDIKERFIDLLKFNFTKMMGDDPQKSEDFGRIINQKRLKKLISYLSTGKIRIGGEYDEQDKYIAPTVMENVGVNDPVMQEEIFGPILPVITYKSKEEVVGWIEKNPFPLSLYIYADDKQVQDYYIQRLRFGGSCVNNGLIHLGNPHLPFGGVGPSGTGQYHGQFGFETFTRPKAVMVSKSWFDVPLWYAPFKGKVGLLKKILKLT